MESSFSYEPVDVKDKYLEPYHQIERKTGLNLFQKSQENIQGLRKDLGALTKEENRMLRLFCSLDFTFIHSSPNRNFKSLQKTGKVYSYKALEDLGISAKGLTGSADIPLGNTGMVFGVLGLEGSKSPLLGDRRNSYIVKFKYLLENSHRQPISGRLSDWYHYEAEREEDPRYIGKTLRRSVHYKKDRVKGKVYIYRHPGGSTSSLHVVRGQEEFMGESILEGIGLLMIKELRIIREGNEAFYIKKLKKFSYNSEEMTSKEKRVLSQLFQSLYSIELSLPYCLNLKKAREHFHISPGVSLRENEVQRIHDCVQRGDLSTLNGLLDAHPDLINAKHKASQRTPLMEGVIRGKLNVVELLLSRGADPYVKTSEERYSALVYAILSEQIGMVKKILTKGNKNINALVTPWEYESASHRWKKSQTPLSLAAKMGNHEIVDLLLQAGAVPRVQHCVITIPLFRDINGTIYFLLGKKCYYDEGGRLKSYGPLLFPGCLKEEFCSDLTEAAHRNLYFLTKLNLKGNFTRIYSYNRVRKDKSVRDCIDFIGVDFGIYKGEGPKNCSIFPMNEDHPLYPNSTGHLLDLQWVNSKFLDKDSLAALTERYFIRRTEHPDEESLKNERVLGSNGLILDMILSKEKKHVQELADQLAFEIEGVEELHRAIRMYKIPRIKDLLKRGVPVEGKAETFSMNGYKGRFSPLMTAFAAGDREAAQVLLKHRANIRVIGQRILHNRTKESFLQNFIRVKDYVMLVFLFRHVSNLKDLEDLNNFSQKEISFFLENENLFLLEILLEKKVKPIQLFLFKIACGMAAIDGVEFLTKWRKKIKSPFKEEAFFLTSPLHIACKANATRAALLLIEKNKFYLMRDGEGHTPLDYAERNNNQEVIEALSNSFPHRVESKVGLKLKEMYPKVNSTICLTFFNGEEAWKFHSHLKQEHYACSHPRGCNVYVEKSVLEDFLNDIPGNREQRKTPTEELFLKAEKIFSCRPMKIEEGFPGNWGDVCWDLFFDPKEITIKELKEMYLHMFSDFFSGDNFREKDNSITITNFEFETIDP